MKNLHDKWKKIIGIVLLMGAGLILAGLFWGVTKEDIWFDEVFSVCFARHSYSDIVSLTAKDVHPPLYYFYLRFLYTALSAVIPQIGEIAVYKAASLLPILGIGVYTICYIRNKTGLLCSGIFMLFLMSMPQLSSYMLEIRMYSLALFFVTAAFLHAYGIITSRKKIHWIFFGLYGILTAYTQYYACVAIIGLYLALLVYLITDRKREGKTLYWWFGCIATSVLSYLPWLPILREQMKRVSEGYWIEPLSIRSIAGCLKFVFLPVSYDIMIDYVLAVIMIIICGISLFLCRKNSLIKEEKFLILTGIWIPVFVFATGFLCSLLNRPVFIYRYLIPALGVFWLSMACVLTKRCHRGAALLLLIPFLLGGFFNLKGLYVEESKKQTEMVRTRQALQNIPKDALIIANFDHVQAVTGFYLENQIALYKTKPEELIRELLPNCVTILDDQAIEKVLDTQKVYFFGSFQARDEIIEKWEQQGIWVTELDSCLLERYWFNIYQLERTNEVEKQR